MITLALAIAITTITLGLLLRLRRRAVLPMPPGPPTKFLLGNALEIRKSKYLWLKLDEYSRSYGGIITCWLLRRPLVALSDPMLITELFEKRATNFSSRPPVMMAKLAGWNDSILFTPYGPRLRTYRKLFHQTFNPRATLDFQSLQISEVKKFMSRLAKEPVDFLKHAQLLAASVAIRITYGYAPLDSNDKFIQSAEEFMAAASEGTTIPGRWLVESMPILRYIPSWFPGATFKRKTEEWANMTIRYRQAPFDFVIHDMAKGTAQPSFTSKLLDREDGSQVSDEDKYLIKIVASNIYGAAGDTTASLVQSFFLAMTLYPKVLVKAQAEIDAYFKSVSTGERVSSRVLNIQDRDALPYTRAVVSEVIRWHPATNIVARYTGEDEVVGDYMIPRNTMIIGNLWSMLHNPDRYPEPETFWPERFLGDNPAIDPADFAFGFGRRLCPGIHIAHQSLWLTISNTLANFTIQKACSVDGSEITPKEEYTTGILSRPEPFECAIRVRSAGSAAFIGEAEGE